MSINNWNTGSRIPFALTSAETIVDMTTGAEVSSAADIATEPVSSSTTITTAIAAAETTVQEVTEIYEEDNFIYFVMAAIGGAVVLIIVIVIIAFIVKSRRTRRHNLRVYRERGERPLTVSLDLIDREEPITENVNGVQNAIYSQDTILPIVVFPSRVQDQTSNQQPGNVQIMGTNGAQNSESNDVNGERTSMEQNETVARASTQNETIAHTPAQTETVESISVVYENTKFSKQTLLTSNDKPKQKSMPNLNDEFKFSQQRRHNSQKHGKTVSINSDYETAFPVFPTHENKKKGEFKIVDNCDGIVGINKNGSAICSINEDHKDMIEVHSEKDDKNISKPRNNKKVKPKVKPKPNAKRFGNNSNNVLSTEAETKDGGNDYENSLAKVKRMKFKEAKLLKTVPPPCNSNYYVNVPENKSNISESMNTTRRQSTEYVNVPDKKSTFSAPKHSELRQSSGYENVPDKVTIDVIPEDPLKRQSSSEYEDEGCVSKLRTYGGCITTLAELDFKDENEIFMEQKDSKHSDSKVKSRPKHSVSMSSRLPVPKPKQYVSEYKPVKSKTKLGASKPDSAKSLSEIPERQAIEYENEDVINALKLSLRRHGKRGFSTSSLETCRQDMVWRTGQKVSAPRACRTIDDDPYLNMDAENNGEYLPMDSENPYVHMETPENDNDYVAMGSNYSYPKSGRDKKLLSDSANKDDDVLFARGFQTCPKPCGGVRCTYSNFSEQSSGYVNMFRSRSTDNVFLYAGSMPFKPK